jgi:hypothetical protein
MTTCPPLGSFMRIPRQFGFDPDEALRLGSVDAPRAMHFPPVKTRAAELRLHSCNDTRRRSLGRAPGLVPAFALGAPELEAPSRGVEIRGELAPNRFDVVPELEHLIVEKAVAVADVLVLP